MINRSTKVRLFIKEPLSLNLHITLSSDQAKYLFKVMRLNEGQSVKIFDGSTGEYEGKILEKSTVSGKILVEKKNKEVSIPSDLWLIFSPLRNNRTEWIIEKATELGVKKIIPVITKRTVSTGVRMNRLKSIMIEALEQCGGTFLPDLMEPDKLINWLNLWPSERQLLFCDESLLQQTSENTISTRHTKKATAILIGPEGGFTRAEGQLIRKLKESRSISLGPRTLRADTAAVSAISIWQNVNSDMA